MKALPTHGGPTARQPGTAKQPRTSAPEVAELLAGEATCNPRGLRGAAQLAAREAQCRAEGAVPGVAEPGPWGPPNKEDEARTISSSIETSRGGIILFTRLPLS